MISPPILLIESSKYSSRGRAKVILIRISYILFSQFAIRFADTPALQSPQEGVVCKTNCKTHKKII